MPLAVTCYSVRSLQAPVVQSAVPSAALSDGPRHQLRGVGVNWPAAPPDSTPTCHLYGDTIKHDAIGCSIIRADGHLAAAPSTASSAVPTTTPSVKRLWCPLAGFTAGPTVKLGCVTGGAASHAAACAVSRDPLFNPPVVVPSGALGYAAGRATGWASTILSSKPIASHKPHGLVLYLAFTLLGPVGVCFPLT